jgi:transcriptional regulator with XRE-family HTH domain
MNTERTTNPSMFVGARVRAVREDRGMSQVQLADMMGITQPHLCNLEGGIKRWTVDMLAAAASGLGVDVRLLVPRAPRRGTRGRLNRK